MNTSNNFSIFLVLLLILTLISCNNEQEHFTCNYYGMSNHTFDNIIKSPSLSFSSESEATKVVDNILKEVGLTKNFLIIENNTVDNAAALVYNNERYIIYNNDFMNLADDITKNKWSSISIIAHEIGHHLQGHTLNSSGSRPDLELEADKFSGFVLAKMGASLQDAQAAVQNLVSQQESETHPPRNKRLLAIAEGFSNARTISEDFNIIKVGDTYWMNEDYTHESGLNRKINGVSVSLFNATNIKRVCPSGWVLPSSEDWAELNEVLIKDSEVRRNFYLNYKVDTLEMAGEKRVFKDADYWAKDNTSISIMTYKQYLQVVSWHDKKLTVEGFTPKIIHSHGKDDYSKEAFESEKRENKFRCRCIKK